MKNATTLVERPTNQPAKTVLKEWATENAVTPARFAQITGYAYDHAWGLMNGKRELTTETIGRLVQAGYVSLAERIAKAMETAQQ